MADPRKRRRLPALAPALLFPLAACLSSGGPITADYRPGAPTLLSWDASFEGMALDLAGRPYAALASPVTLHLEAVGGGKYAVYFEGTLDFPLLDPWLGLPLGHYAFPMDMLDGQTGDYDQDFALEPHGVFAFWGGMRFMPPGLGFTDVDLRFTLVPDDAVLPQASTARLTWQATLDSQGGGAGVFASWSRLQGVETVALRIQD